MTDYVCHSCRDEFEANDMCDHFDDVNKHQWCLDCCENFQEKKYPREWDDLD